MKQAIVVLSAAVFLAVLPGRASANSAPVVSNITVSLRTDGSKKVDIRYNLSDPDGDTCAASYSQTAYSGAVFSVRSKGGRTVKSIEIESYFLYYEGRSLREYCL